MSRAIGAAQKNFYMHKSPKKRAQGARIRKIRKLIDDTQAEFARRLGISLAYVVALENGQRPVKQRVADLILQATTIHPEGALGNMGKSDQPINVVGMPITNPEDAGVGLEKKLYPHQPIADEWLIDDLCSDVRTFLKAATRKGKFFIAQYYIGKLIEKTSNDFGLPARKKIALSEGADG